MVVVTEHWLILEGEEALVKKDRYILIKVIEFKDLE